MMANRDSGDECGCARCQADATPDLLQRAVDENLGFAIESGYTEIKTWLAADVATDLIAFCDDAIVQAASIAALENACADWLSRQ